MHKRTYFHIHSSCICYKKELVFVIKKKPYFMFILGWNDMFDVFNDKRK